MVRGSRVVSYSRSVYVYSFELQGCSLVAVCNIAEIAIFNVPQLVFLYRRTTFYLHVCIRKTARIEDCVWQDKVFITV
jgi:hypothetical protein